MTKLNREMWPSDPYECPYCFPKNKLNGSIDKPF